MENNFNSSSTDSYFNQYIKTNINHVISKTWNLQNTREEIFRSRELLKVLEDNLFPNHYKTLALENAKFIFDIVIEDFARWTVKKSILNVFDNCLNNMTEIERYVVSHNLLSRKAYNLYYLYKLIDIVSVYGDYDFQVLIIKIIFKTFEKNNYLINELIPESEDLQNKFLEITKENIDGSVRSFLNSINQRSRKIFSLKCQTIRLGSVECTGNNSGLWIDFNLIDKIASWYTNIEALLIEKDQEINNKFFNLILLFQRDVQVVTIKRNLCKTIGVTFTLKKSCVSYYEKYQHLLDGAKTLNILLDYSPEAEYLVRSVLPTIYRTKFMHKFSKRRNLSLNMNPYVKIPTTTSTNYEIINTLSSSNSLLDTHSISEIVSYGEDQVRTRNTISDFTTSIVKHNILKHRDLNIKLPSHTSKIYIESEKDLLNSEGTKEHDLDDMNLFFESEEQLLTMARTFDAINSVLNSRVFSNVTNTNSIDITQIKHHTPPVEQTSTTPSKSNIFQKSSKKESTGRNIFTAAFNPNKNQNVLGLTNTSTITDSLRKVQATTNTGKVGKAKKRNRHSFVGSINLRDDVKSDENTDTDIPYNCDIGKSKYFSAQKIKTNKYLKLNVNKNDERNIENFKFNRKITEINYNLRFQTHNHLKEKLDKIKNKYNFIQTKNTKHERREKSFNVDHYHSIIVSEQSEVSSIEQCRAIDEEIASDSSSPLFRDRRKPKPIVDSSGTDDEMYKISEMNGNNILNPYVQITPLPLLNNTLANSLEDELVSDCMISNNKNIIDKQNILLYKEKSIENIDVSHSELKTKHLEANMSSSNVSIWPKSAILGNTEVKLCSKDFVGKYLLIIGYIIDTSIIEPTLFSEITQLSEKFEDFNNLGATILVCLKGPNLSFPDWINQLKNQEFPQKLQVPLIFDAEGHFMSDFGVYLKNFKSEMKILILVNDRGDVIYKSMFSIFDEVDIVNLLNLLRHFQMRD